MKRIAKKSQKAAPDCENLPATTATSQIQKVCTVGKGSTNSAASTCKTMDRLHRQLARTENCENAPNNLTVLASTRNRMHAKCGRTERRGVVATREIVRAGRACS